MRRLTTAALPLLLLAAGCGGPAPSGARAAPPANGDRAASGDDDPAPLEDDPSPWLRDLAEGETLLYHVTRQDGGEDEVRFQISDVVRRGGGVAVRLNPIGTPLLDSPVFARWMVADADTLYGLEETASLTQPGIEPLDARGAIVTEARDAVAWRVERSWTDGTATSVLGAAATEGGWQIEGVQRSVEGAVRGTGCVRLRRQEGEVTTRMLICANLGVVELARTGGDESDAQSWRLVDVGALGEEML